MNYEEILQDLSNTLKSSRFAHTLGVVDTAVKLAGIYEYDVEKARLAALLHDCAKYMPDSERIGFCEARGVAVTDAERVNTSLLHAKCGAILAEEKYGVSDPEILHAICVHTTGCPGMNLLDKIIFVADYIEPGRDKAPHLEELRKLAVENLNATAYYILKDTLDYLEGCDLPIDPATRNTYLYFKENYMENESRKMAQIAYHALADKKAEEIRVIDISEVSVIADYFLIATVNNTSQMAAVVDGVDEAMYKAGYKNAQTEGNANSSWVLIDYKDIIVHVFSKEDRLFYDLERIWKDGKTIEPEEL